MTVLQYFDLKDGSDRFDFLSEPDIDLLCSLLNTSIQNLVNINTQNLAGDDEFNYYVFDLYLTMLNQDGEYYGIFRLCEYNNIKYVVNDNEIYIEKQYTEMFSQID